MRKAKALAAKRQVSLTQLIETGLRLQVEEKVVHTPALSLHVCPESKKAARFAIGLPAEARTWSAGKWEEWADAHEG